MKRKEQYKLPPRTPKFLSKETCAAEFEVSIATWDEWVKAGLVPKPYMLGNSSAIPRWSWDEIIECIVARGKNKETLGSSDFNLSALKDLYGGGKRQRSAKNDRGVPA